MPILALLSNFLFYTDSETGITSWPAPAGEIIRYPVRQGPKLTGRGIEWVYFPPFQ